MGLFSGELMFGGACYWREFCISQWVVLDNKIALNTKVTVCKSLKHLTLTVHGLIFGRACYQDICSEIWGLIFGGAYYQNFTTYLPL